MDKETFIKTIKDRAARTVRGKAFMYFSLPLLGIPVFGMILAPQLLDLTVEQDRWILVCILGGSITGFILAPLIGHLIGRKRYGSHLQAVYDEIDVDEHIIRAIRRWIERYTPYLFEDGDILEFYGIRSAIDQFRDNKDVSQMAQTLKKFRRKEGEYHWLAEEDLLFKKEFRRAQKAADSTEDYLRQLDIRGLLIDTDFSEKLKDKLLKQYQDLKTEEDALSKGLKAKKEFAKEIYGLSFS